MRRLVLPGVALLDILLVLFTRHWDYFPFAAIFGLSLLLTMCFSPLAKALAVRLWGSAGFFKRILARFTKCRPRCGAGSPST